MSVKQTRVGKRAQAPYHYTECGLDNVWIDGLGVCMDDSGDTTFTIPNITGLHLEIARSIIFDQTGMSGEELRFLRTEMGLTQAELAVVLHTKPLTINRWERGKNPIDANAMTVIRAVAISRLKLDDVESIETLASRSRTDVAPTQLVIDGSDVTQYRANVRPLAA